LEAVIGLAAVLLAALYWALERVFEEAEYSQRVFGSKGVWGR
jgi:hypothetical protein